MDLLQAVQSGSLKEVKKAWKSYKRTNDPNCSTDYKALNTALNSGNIYLAKFLIDQGCKVNETCEIDSTSLHSSPLHTAVELKDIELIYKLLFAKASISAINQDNNTPLHLAFLLEYTEVVNIMLEYISHDDNIANLKNKHGLTHMHIACTTDKLIVIKKYLEASVELDDAVNLDSPKWSGFTVFHFAVTFRSLCALKTLLNNESWDGKGMQEDSNGNTPWDLACGCLEEYSDIINIMSKHQRKTHPNAYLALAEIEMGKLKDRFVNTPTAFHYACMGDNPGLVRNFLEQGESVKTCVSCEMKIFPMYRALHFAVVGGCEEIVKLLLENDADVTDTNYYRMTALHLAMYRKFYRNSWEDVITTNEKVRKLVDILYTRSIVRNKEVNRRDNNLLSYFHIAIVRNDLKLVKKMLASNNNNIANSKVLPNDHGFSMYRPLHFAARYGHKKMFDLLVKNSAEVAAVSCDGTPLEIAIWMGHTDIIEVLLDIGARTDVTAGNIMLVHKIADIDNDIEYENIQNRQLLNRYIERLVELGCDMNARNENGKTALHYCTDSELCLRQVLENGADINLQNNSGDTPLANLCKNFDIYDKTLVTFTILRDHVKNLMALGVQINPQNIEYRDFSYDDDTDTDDDENKIKDFVASTEQLQEMEMMKREKLDEKMTLYDFMKLENVDAVVYAKNEVLKSIVENAKSRYSVYGYLIKAQYKKSQNYGGKKASTKRTLSSTSSKENDSKRKRIDEI